MSFQKNTSGQKWLIFAFDRTTNAPKTGDAANITAKIRKDYTSAVATNDTNPDELEDGYYEFTLTQTETNATIIDLLPESTTANIQVIGVPGRSFVVPTNFPTLGIASDGDLTKVNTLDGHTAQTGDTYALANGSSGFVATKADTAAILVDTGTTLQGELDGIQADTEDIQARLPAALTADGNIKADTLRVGGTLQTEGDIPALVTTVDGVVDGIQVDLSNGTDGLGALKTAIQAVVTTAMTESYAADGVAPTPAQALMLILQRLTEFVIVGDTITVKKLDGTTAAATLTMDSDTAPTSSTRAT